MPEDTLSYDARKQIFVNYIKERPSYDESKWKLTKNFGQSNKARIMDGGLFVGNANLDKIHEETVGHVFATNVGLPPGDEFWFAVYVSSDLESLHQRLRFLKKQGEQGVEGYSDSNNNAKLNLYSDDGIYIENKGFYDGFSKADEFSPEESGPPIEVDRIVYSVFSRSSVGRRTNVAAGSMADRLSQFVGDDHMIRIDPWPGQSVTSGIPRRDPAEVPLDNVVQGVESLGGVYSRKTIEQYHTGINHLPHKHFVILTGVSGTGKTGLATRYARTVHGIDEKSREDPFLFMCPVRPEWTDPTGLIGYYDVIGDQYVVPPFLEAMLVADNNPNTPVFVCLDEMNLARVEYYLADVLSAIESREAIDLHSGATPIKGNHGGEVPPSLRVPSNLYITGTINIDETTQPLSDKVLDRAVVLQLQASSPGHYLDRLADDDSNLEDTVEDCREVLNRVHSILADEGLAFGYRVAEEFVRYVQFARENGGRSISSLIDDQMVQKVLPKLQGSHRQRPMLNDLEALFERRGLQRSSEQIEEMKEELSEIGSFQATR